MQWFDGLDDDDASSRVDSATFSLPGGTEDAFLTELGQLNAFPAVLAAAASPAASPPRSSLLASPSRFRRPQRLDVTPRQRTASMGGAGSPSPPVRRSPALSVYDNPLSQPGSPALESRSPSPVRAVPPPTIRRVRPSPPRPDLAALEQGWDSPTSPNIRLRYTSAFHNRKLDY